MNAWKVLRSDYILESPWIKLRKDVVEQRQGHIVDPFYVVEYPDWSCVVALVDDASLLMVEQYRHGSGRTSLELPAGVIDPDETPLHAAQREMEEETGFRASEWAALGACAPEPSKQTNRAHVFFASGLHGGNRQQLDETESIRVRKVPVAELDDCIARGEIFHGIHLYALMLARSRGLLAL